MYYYVLVCLHSLKQQNECQELNAATFTQILYLNRTFRFFFCLFVSHDTTVLYKSIFFKPKILTT